jgi:predicted acylesterase/phospholipase RssA
MTDQVKRAVVLSGGGANGAYEAGCLKAIFGGESPATDKTPIEADIFTGTSVGSFNAGFLVSRTAGGESCLQAAEELEKTWLERIAEHPEGCNNGAFRIRADLLDYLDPRCFAKAPLKPFQELAEDSMFFAQETAKRSLAFVTGKGSVARRAVELFDLASALSTTPLHDLVEDTIDLGAVLAPQAKVLNVIATNWDLGQVVVFTNKTEPAYTGDRYTLRQLTEANGHKAVLASTAIPGVFPPVRIAFDGDADSFYFVDGGVLMNTPLSPAIQVGAREIHVVYFEPRLDRLADDFLPNTLDTMNRFVHVAVANLVREDIEEVRKVNEQAAVAERIEPIVEQLKKDPILEQQRSKKSQDLQAAVERAEGFIDKLANRRQLTVHNHYPSKPLGGVLGLLNFKRHRMLELVELGFNDTVRHDCERNRCVLPAA